MVPASVFFRRGIKNNRSTMTRNRTAVLFVRCPDQRGLVARIADFVFRHDGNIIDSDHHSDAETGLFLMRVEWELDGMRSTRDQLEASLSELAAALHMTWELHFSDQRQRIAIFVSRFNHCLYDLLWRGNIGELDGEIAVVVSNHEELRSVAQRFGVPFHVHEVTEATKAAAEQAQLELLERYDIDLVVLARYMQILSEDFVARFPNRIINIHHSFLPAFAGSRPYHQAHARGVKLIGATSHYVTGELDQGPIIEQDVTRASHRDTVVDLTRKGRDLERLVLARAVRLHLQHRVLAYGRKTVVFD
jgi:formyltetrahydrofolate deformylase